MTDLDRFARLAMHLRHQRDSIARCLANAACDGNQYLDHWTGLYRKARHDEIFAHTLLDAALSAERAERVADRAAAERTA